MSKPLPNEQIELTNYFTPCYNTLRWCKPQAAVAQSVERRIGSAEVTGPIPVSSFKIKALYFSGTHEKPHKYRVFRYIIKRNRSNQST